MKTAIFSNACLLVAAMLVAGFSSVSAQITYVRLHNDGVLRLHEMNSNGTGDTIINFPFAQVGFPVWTRDGSRLGVSAYKPSQTNRHTWNVYSIARANGAVTR